MIPLPNLKDEDEIKKIIEGLNFAGELFRKNGFTLCYHNHHFEFMKNSDGETWLEHMVKNAPYIHFTLDVYWAQYGGASIVEILEKLKGRADCVHLKDYKIELKDCTCVPRFAALGDGNIDIPSIIKTAEKLGTEYFIVEQDDACEYPDPFCEVGKSIKYLFKSVL